MFNLQEVAHGGFSALGLDDKIVKELSILGYEEPTPIQSEAIPHLLSGKDILGQAATGTGKTAAFALPVIQNIFAAGKKSKGGQPIAIVLTPTRELAIQVAEAMHKYGRTMGVTVLPIYGGADMRTQLKALSRGVDVVVATPGRALDHIRRGSLLLDKIDTVVLDEADEMLDMGFAEDLEAILEKAPEDRQTALFSATMAPKVAAIANKHLKDPARINIARDTLKVGTTPKVKQIAYIVPRAHKTATLGRVLDMENPGSTIVFCRTRTEVDELTESLTVRGYTAGALHGGLSQAQRDRIMKKFRTGGMDLLIATDVAARGLDVDHLSHVVNYSVPTSPDIYVHRIGRTGRAGREGVGITLVEPKEHGYIRNVERVTKQKIEILTVPTVEDLNTRRLEITKTEIEAALKQGGGESLRSIISSLANDGYDIMDVASAALKVAHKALGNDAENEVNIPVYEPGKSSKSRSGKPRDRGDRGDRGERSGYGSGEKSGRYKDRSDSGAGSKDRGGYKGKSEFKGKSDYKGKSEYKSKSEFKERSGGSDRFSSKERGSEAGDRYGSKERSFKERPARERSARDSEGSGREERSSGGFKFKGSIGRGTFAGKSEGRSGGRPGTSKSGAKFGKSSGGKSSPKKSGAKSSKRSRY